MSTSAIADRFGHHINTIRQCHSQLRMVNDYVERAGLASPPSSIQTLVDGLSQYVKWATHESDTVTTALDTQTAAAKSTGQSQSGGAA